ncbi:nickel pincer cofactor biosynthesis protein LarB [Liquorilactobacillus vini]|uniref:nickel pincer cofactor biosynthesis protein LarB n=1 Tax=Liquorilactobacillus vini TaxID=238015 RepID=UPI00055014D5|nr:nickel pincer cofactor biosynthesis protein LarB [Liquorilactobacillus vini]
MNFVKGEIANIDTDRLKRRGFSEVIFGKNKTWQEIKQIMDVLLVEKQPVLVTQLSPEKFNKLAKFNSKLTYFENSKILIAGEKNPGLSKGKVCVICGGTSDLPIAWETIDVLNWMGVNNFHFFDIGVAGLQRLLFYKDRIASADIIIAIAGMEGSLATVVSGLVNSPVIAVPTSVGYGANLHGITTLLSMITSCSSGITVTNIDNGFGAAFQAGLFIKKINQY